MSPRFVMYGGLYLKLMILIKLFLIFLSSPLVALLSMVTSHCFLYASLIDSGWGDKLSGIEN